ncbi:hypothetical protein Tco_1476679 [Tanacetum coccineum]
MPSELDTVNPSNCCFKMYFCNLLDQHFHQIWIDGIPPFLLHAHLMEFSLDDLLFSQGSDTTSERMDDPNITMKQYIRLEEEKALKHGKVFNWDTARYSKIWYDEDVYDLRSVETEFPDLENDKEKVNMPLFPTPEPTVSCIDDLDIFKDFENEFPTIVYNDALMSKSDFSTEPTLCPQHIDKFDLKDETLLSEYDKVEQNVLYFNDLFPFYIIYLDD